MSPFDNSVKSEAEVISTYQYNLKANNTTETSERYNKDSDCSIWLIVKIADDLKKSVTVNVVEGVDTLDTPDEPEAPATTGFGVLASLASLGAVAVLLLRRE